MKMSETKPSLFELLMLRYEFEEYNRGFKSMPANGAVESLKRFIASGYGRNRQRPNADRALEIAKTILANLPVLEVIPD